MEIVAIFVVKILICHIKNCNMRKNLLALFTVAVAGTALVSADEWTPIGQGVYYEDLMPALDPTIEPG